MALFLDPTDINAKLVKLIREADKFLYLISPYIRFHERIKDELISKKNERDLKITVVFGKNPHDLSKSLDEEQYEFLKSFSNISIRYSEHLHAKFYASEDAALITSMNLYDYSQNNNIESGVLLLSPDANSRSKEFGSEVDEHAYREAIAYFNKVIERSELIEPGQINGYCIRTGNKIPFNPEKPMSYTAFSSWGRFSNPHYIEKFCHSCGKQEATSMVKPLCYECFKRMN